MSLQTKHYYEKRRDWKSCLAAREMVAEMAPKMLVGSQHCLHKMLAISR